MKVLQICVKPPFPEVDGGAVAMASTLRSLIMLGCDLTVLSFITHKHPNIEIPNEIEGKFHLLTAPVDLRIKPYDALLNLFSTESYHAKRFKSKEVEEILVDLLSSQKFDLILLETVFPAVYLELIRGLSKAKVVIRMHNIESNVWARTADKEGGPLKRWYLRLLAHRLKKFEIPALEQVDGLMTISVDDQKQLKEWNVKTTCQTIPVGLDLSHYPINDTEWQEQPTLFHLAAMDWMPNKKAVDWFLCFVWEELIERHPRVKLFLAGRKMPAALFDKISPNLFVQDEVSSAIDFMQDKSIMIVPLLSGSGLRIKILEGMALGKAIVSTTVGTSGLTVKNGEHLFVADSPEAFVDAISNLIEDPELVRKVGQNARKLVEEKYSLSTVAEATADFLQKFVPVRNEL